MQCDSKLSMYLQGPYFMWHLSHYFLPLTCGQSAESATLITINKPTQSGNQQLSDKIKAVFHQQSSVLLTANNACSLFSTTHIFISTDNNFKLYGIQTSSINAFYKFLVIITVYKTHLMHEDQRSFKCIIYIFICGIRYVASLDFPPPEFQVTVPQFVAGKKNIMEE